MKINLLLILLIIVAVNSNNTPKNARIVGGQEAFAGQFPFSAAIYKHTSDGTYFCGGCLFHHIWIITAGHCVYNATSFTIRLGTNSLSTTNENSMLLATESYIVHPDFNPLTLENDIGMVRLRSPISFTDYIRPVDFLPTSELADYTVTKAIGWGQTDDATPNLVDELRWVSVTTLSNAECKIVYGNQISDSMVCATGNFNGGACTGDSGGPLIFDMHIPTYTMIVGVSSFISQNGCESTDPSGYTRIFPYVDWIHGILTNPNNTITNNN